MKSIIKLFVLLITVLPLTNVLATESITGTWQGKLVTGHGTEITIQFVIIQDVNGSYSIILNSLDEGGMKNVKANSVVYTSGLLKIDAADVSGSYEGIVKDGKIDGKWKQEGLSFPLMLSPYEKSTFSKKDMDTLLGTWNGKSVSPEDAAVELPSSICVIRFEMSEKGEFTGIMSAPEMRGIPDAPITDMGIRDGIFSFKIAGGVREFKGKLTDKKIVGELTFPSIPEAEAQSVTFKKGEYVAPVYGLSLPKEIMDQLRGKWNGKIGSLNVVFRFEETKDADFVSFLDSPDQGAFGIPFTDAEFNNRELTLKENNIHCEFKGKLSGDNMVGTWIQNGARWSLSLKKEKP